MSKGSLLRAAGAPSEGSPGAEPTPGSPTVMIIITAIMNSNMYVYIYIYIYIYIYTCACIYIYIYIYTHMHVIYHIDTNIII